LILYGNKKEVLKKKRNDKAVLVTGKGVVGTIRIKEYFTD